MDTTEEPLTPPERLEAIFAADQPPIEKLTHAFRELTDCIAEDGCRQVELFKAMGDDEEVVKQQIKLSTMETARRLFDECHARALGGRTDR